MFKPRCRHERRKKSLHISYVGGWARAARCRAQGHALPGGPRGGCRAISWDAACLEVLTHCIRAVFPLGKDQTLALYKKTSKMSHKENELAFWGDVWQSRLETRPCGGRRMLRPCPRQLGRAGEHAVRTESPAPGFLAWASSCF